jgi:hypothetical protein
MVHSFLRRGAIVLATVAVIGVAILPTAANAATTIDGPIGLGTAETFAVLGGSTVTMIPPNPIVGDIGLSPGSAVTGYDPLTHTGALHIADGVANQAQIDLTTAYNTAASLSPSQSSLTNLTGPSYGPGVYSGGALSVSGSLTLTGGAESVWVFQAASTLTVATGAVISVTGGASACNVFWQVGTSATVGGGAAFVGTIMADQSITLVTNATVTGRLLARIGAVNLDQNTITRPSGCSATGGTVRTSPTFTSAGPLAGVEGTDYSYTLTSSGSPAATYTVTSGALPTGLSLNPTTGLISGRPTAAGTYTFTVAAANGTTPDAVATYTLVIAADLTPRLAESGSDLTVPLLSGGVLLAAGMSLLLARGARKARRR